MKCLNTEEWSRGFKEGDAIFASCIQRGAGGKMTRHHNRWVRQWSSKTVSSEEGRLSWSFTVPPESSTTGTSYTRYEAARGRMRAEGPNEGKQRRGYVMKLRTAGGTKGHVAAEYSLQAADVRRSRTRIISNEDKEIWRIGAVKRWMDGWMDGEMRIMKEEGGGRWEHKWKLETNTVRLH